jgi:hypothetical protein
MIANRGESPEGFDQKVSTRSLSNRCVAGYARPHIIMPALRERHIKAFHWIMSKFGDLQTTIVLLLVGSLLIGLSFTALLPPVVSRVFRTFGSG